MRQVGAAVCLGFVLLAGCHYGPNRRDTPVTRDTVMPPAPKVPQLVAYLNDNARRVQAVRCERVAIDAEQDGQKIGLDGIMVCQKPRNFRLRAKALGNPAVDVGSNSEEFWYWISQNKPPDVFHCSYADLARGVSIPFPFQPDMIVMALGIAEYDPAAKYQLKETPTTLELSEATTSPQGKPIRKVTVFDRREAVPARGRPQVIAYALLDERGGTICKVDVRRVAVNRETGAVLPVDVTLVWPAMKAKMQMQFSNVKVVNVSPEQAGRLFQRKDLAGYRSVDLARGVVDSPGPQRASFPPR